MLNKLIDAGKAVGQSAKERLFRYTAGLQDLSAVEKLIHSKFRSDADDLTSISQYLFELGGKRMRPVLCLMTADMLGLPTSDPRLCDIAAGIELIHMATLLHDDIIDNSPLRRRKESPLVRFGVSPTLLAGDFLLVRAFSLCSKLPPFVIAQTEEACVALTEGEILEKSLVETRHTVESSINVARKKTAALFKLATISASYLALDDCESTRRLGDFGENLGIAFQILDDVLDVTADEDLLGKKTGSDLRERKPSLVNVLWLDSGSQLARTLTAPPGPANEEFVSSAVAELRNGKVIDEARKIALDFAGKARTALDSVLNAEQLPEQRAENLIALADYCLERLF